MNNGESAFGRCFNTVGADPLWVQPSKTKVSADLDALWIILPATEIDIRRSMASCPNRRSHRPATNKPRPPWPSRNADPTAKPTFVKDVQPNLKKQLCANSTKDKRNASPLILLKATTGKRSRNAVPYLARRSQNTNNG